MTVVEAIVQRASVALLTPGTMVVWSSPAGPRKVAVVSAGLESNTVVVSHEGQIIALPLSTFVYGHLALPAQ